MIKYEIEVDDTAVRAALRRLIEAGTDLRPAMQDIGELLLESTKRRFAASTAPDGTRWAPNAETTLMRFLAGRGGLSKRRGRGPTAKGARLAAAKRPLIGESRRLSTEIAVRVGERSVEVGSGLVYSAVQQFGASKGAFGRTSRGAPIPWGNIPARPFLGLSDDDRAGILDILNAHLRRAAGV